jgi:DNA-binding NtrC family response regulator
VDDDERVLFVLRHALMKSSNGTEIVTARSGYEALDKAREMSFDLLITDLRMPEMSGIELTETFKSLHPDTVVIWITAFGCHRVADEAPRLGVSLCLDKPLELPQIRGAVREALDAGNGQLQDGNVDGAI